MATANPKEEEKATGRMASKMSTASLRASIRSHKGHFTRERRFLQDLASGELPDLVRMNNLVDGLQTRIEKIADIVDEIAISEPEAELEHKPLLDELMDSLGEAGRMISSAGQGRSQGGDHYHAHFKPVSDLKPPLLSQESTPSWLLKIVDDMLVQAPTRALLFSRLRIVLDRCRTAGIKLSLPKLEIGQAVKFAGFLATSEGIKPDPSKLSSIKNFPRPDLAHSTVHLRELLKKVNAFTWLEVHEHEFTFTKELLCSSAVVHPFDPTLATELLTDASRLHGLGYALIQRNSTSRPRLIQCGSCSLTPAQRNYATIELECSAIVWAITKCDSYLVDTPGGRFRRNRRFLRCDTSTQDSQSPPSATAISNPIPIIKDGDLRRSHRIRAKRVVRFNDRVQFI